jgi:hypothetical protein
MLKNRDKVAGHPNHAGVRRIVVTIPGDLSRGPQTLYVQPCGIDADENRDLLAALAISGVLIPM